MLLSISLCIREGWRTSRSVNTGIAKISLTPLPPGTQRQNWDFFGTIFGLNTGLFVIFRKNLGRVRTPPLLLGNASIFRPFVTATLPKPIPLIVFYRLASMGFQWFPEFRCKGQKCIVHSPITHIPHTLTIPATLTNILQST